ncbi:hypothetical protein HanXRQr2_Chr09g0373271 [Helianthus annuus]|uniref:Uncharacterized protein n=1 Tax=Helianthus annuus TaxID=4232 RepID=A0A9K3N7V5_HELAN|nr:hypothetical protein HanXRQr2_Chr09g0373271 [Helianthus annuus]
MILQLFDKYPRHKNTISRVTSRVTRPINGGRKILDEPHHVTNVVDYM